MFTRFLSSAVLMTTAIASLGFAGSAAAEDGELELEIDFATTDTNSDGKLSKEEFTVPILASLTEHLSQQVGQQQAEEMARQMAPQIVEGLFSNLDKDFDGMLSEAEVTALGG